MSTVVRADKEGKAGAEEGVAGGELRLAGPLDSKISDSSVSVDSGESVRLSSSEPGGLDGGGKVSEQRARLSCPGG